MSTAPTKPMSEWAPLLLAAAQKVDLEFYLRVGLTLHEEQALSELRDAIVSAGGQI